MPLGAFKQALLAAAGVSTGDVVLISTATADDSAALSFTSGINSTYSHYVWEIININPATEEYFFQFQVNGSGESGFDEEITSTYFRARHGENGAGAALAYRSARDQATGTAYQDLGGPGSQADETTCGFLFMANPSSATFSKQFWGEQQTANWDSYTWNTFAAGYVMQTKAITEISFKMASGNIAAGKIKMYGVK